MALIEQGILGPFSGHIGNIIGYIRNGQFCMRSMPSHYHDRRSRQQLENRSRFTLVMKLMSLVRPVITLGFHPFATDITEMNAATRANYYSLVKPNGNSLKYNYPGLILSRGPVEPLTTPIQTLTGNTLQLYWNTHSIPGAGQDNVSVVLFNASRMTMKFFHNIAQRQDGTATLAIPNTWSHEEIHIYLLVERNNNYSNSTYAGILPWPQQTTLTNPSNPTDNPEFLSHQSAVKLLFPSPLIRPHG